MSEFTIGQKVIDQYGTLVVITEMIEPNHRFRVGDWAGIVLYHSISHYIGSRYIENLNDNSIWRLLGRNQKLHSPIKFHVGDLVSDDYYLRGDMMVTRIHNGVVHCVNIHNGESFQYNPDCLVRIEESEVGNGCAG